jgi:hypothetical protein
VGKPLLEQVVDWALGRPEFAGFTAERNVEVRGVKREVIYKVDVVLVRRNRLSFIFRSGPMSGTAVAITVGRGAAPMTARDVAGVQQMAADVFQSVYKGREKVPVQLWVHITTQPYDSTARQLAGQMRLTWFGHIDEEGNVEQVL